MPPEMQQGPPGMQPMQSMQRAAPSLPPQLGGQGPDPAQFMQQLTPEQQSQLQQKMAMMSAEEQEQYITMLTSNWTQQANDAQADMTRADALRQDAPGGTWTRNAYVAASPLEHIATAMQNRKQQEAYDTGVEARTTARKGGADTRKSAAEDFLAARVNAVRQQ